MYTINPDRFSFSRRNAWSIGMALLLLWSTACSTGGNDEPADSGEGPDDSPPAEGTLYFPPDPGGDWETVTPLSLGWDETKIPALEDHLEASGTKGFIVLVGGRIALEAYFEGHDENSLWYWASAGKTLTCATVGIAQHEGLLSIGDPTSDYLGVGWTSASPEQETAITIRHQLTMTTGLDDSDFECTESACLPYLAPAGTRWSYHNGPYTLLQSVVSAAVGEDFDDYFNRKLDDPLGLNGFWFNSLEGNRVYYSNTRSMARFGLCVLADGQWSDQTVLQDEGFLGEMRSPSQDINKSYGYLWWLNGQESYRPPGLQIELQGSIVPEAPSDMYAGLGKNDQKVYVVPSLDMVVVRMGENPGYSGLALTAYDSEIWERLNAVIGR